MAGKLSDSRDYISAFKTKYREETAALI